MSQSHKAIATTAKGVVEEITVPTTELGPGEVRIRVDYAAAIPLDAYQVDRGLYIQVYPQTLGSSATGKVVEVGQNVHDLKVGDKVAALAFGGTFNRALQEYVVCSRFMVGKLPENYNLADAAAIPDNLVTAYWILFGPHINLGRPSTFPSPTVPADAEEPILVYGASSSAGQYLVQLLKLAGYTNIIATGSPRNHELLQKLGVRHVINYRSEDVVKDILDKAGKKVNLAIDVISASPTLNVIAQVLAPSGKVAVLLPVKEGDTITNDVETEMVTAIPQRVKEKFTTQEVIPVSSLNFLSDEWVRANLMPKILPQLLESGVLQPNPIRLLKEGTFKERAETAFDLLRNNKVSGEKVIVAVNDEKN